MMGVLEEEFYNLPTAEYAHRRGFLSRLLTVYHAAFQACADLKNVEVMEVLVEMLEKEGNPQDVFVVIQIMRCYLHSGDLERGRKVFDDYMSSNKAPVSELYTTLIEGALIGYTPEGMQIAQETLEKMISKNILLPPRTGSDLLLVAAQEKTGGYIMANYIWDVMQSREMVPFFNAVEAYFKGLKTRQIPEDDPRLQHVTRTYEDLYWRLRRAPRRSG